MAKIDSCDWSRTRFMDKDLSYAVTKVFVDLYNNNLIYKDKLVNWDIICKPPFQI